MLKGTYIRSTLLTIDKIFIGQHAFAIKCTRRLFSSDSLESYSSLHCYSNYRKASKFGRIERSKLANAIKVLNYHCCREKASEFVPLFETWWKLFSPHLRDIGKYELCDIIHRLGRINAISDGLLRHNLTVDHMNCLEEPLIVDNAWRFKKSGKLLNGISNLRKPSDEYASTWQRVMPIIIEDTLEKMKALEEENKLYLFVRLSRFTHVRAVLSSTELKQLADSLLARMKNTHANLMRNATTRQNVASPISIAEYAATWYLLTAVVTFFVEKKANPSDFMLDQNDGHNSISNFWREWCSLVKLVSSFQDDTLPSLNDPNNYIDKTNVSNLVAVLWISSMQLAYDFGYVPEILDISPGLAHVLQSNGPRLISWTNSVALLHAIEGFLLKCKTTTTPAHLNTRNLTAVKKSARAIYVRGLEKRHNDGHDFGFVYNQMVSRGCINVREAAQQNTFRICSLRDVYPNGYRHADED